MKSALIFTSIVGAIVTQPALAATASAEINWASFSVVLYDLDPLDGITPSLTWAGESTYVQASDASSWIDDSAADWTTAISATSSASTASADTSMLIVAANAQPGESRWADVTRSGIFEVSANTLAVFSALASYSATASTANAQADAYIYFDTWGLGTNGTGNQGSYSEFGSYDWYSNTPTPLSDKGTISVTFANLGATPLSGEFIASANSSAYVAAVPEPDSYAMLLAGLGLVGLVVRRRI